MNCFWDGEAGVWIGDS
ncbi:MAG: DUF1902 domain-containing protein [Oscillatoriales cyanobacterium RM1_1_9]|nr:DUF1902 domain-containing protein [Oscillatoriales cyanobacterium SM2_3_0]NJO47410.1 DUF1902 domain-containing protein [Oscillatoriales cyanobacterium RM2_1_1]NJO70828.1 DUF1902 domain-containing protein [Oscillatoriales cyanobacterium RM1_1_9]